MFSIKNRYGSKYITYQSVLIFDRPDATVFHGSSFAVKKLRAHSVAYTRSAVFVPEHRAAHTSLLCHAFSGNSFCIVLRSSKTDLKLVSCPSGAIISPCHSLCSLPVTVIVKVMSICCPPLSTGATLPVLQSEPRNSAYSRRISHRTRRPGSENHLGYQYQPASLITRVPVCLRSVPIWT